VWFVLLNVYRQSTLKDLITQAQKSGVALLSVMLDNPAGYGRIIRKDNFWFGRIHTRAFAGSKNDGVNVIHNCILLNNGI
jgi:bifunctional N-acetylglucosamine-1-phosphate-uridyltransferase/glucosamine-1-phosphate-acetyltransferase GlmU-like protein